VKILYDQNDKAVKLFVKEVKLLRFVDLLDLLFVGINKTPQMEKKSKHLHATIFGCRALLFNYFQSRSFEIVSTRKQKLQFVETQQQKGQRKHQTKPDYSTKEETLQQKNKTTNNK